MQQLASDCKQKIFADEPFVELYSLHLQCKNSIGPGTWECWSAHLHINLLKRESKLARHVQILKRRN